MNEFDKTLYIVDKRQKLHFEQLFRFHKVFWFWSRRIYSCRIWDRK